LRDRGLVAPGWRADLVLLENLQECRVHSVIAGGRPVEAALFDARAPLAPVGLDSVRLAPVSAEDFRVPAGAGRTPVIGVRAGRIITDRLDFELPARGGQVEAHLDQDAVKVSVVARHGKNRNVGRGFVHGFGLKRGAIASSVGHDSHNITVIGVDDADMAAAVNRIIAMQGGFVVAAGGEIRAELALPVAGLMSLEPFETVKAKLIALRAAAKGLGCTLPEPFLQVAFLPLPVIPHLKITDFGLFDVDSFALVES
jgi:adenine deaminase